jgi:hypothetical protein
VNTSTASPESKSSLEGRGLWAFWFAVALAAAGAVAPLVLSGGSTRINGSLIPFGVAAIAFGACTLLYHHGRVIATTLYFVASLAIVYGILSTLAVPLRIAVLGTCLESGPCPLGLERPITPSESTALGFVIGIGIVAILAGFFGLRALFHRYRRRVIVSAEPPPVRRIAPVAVGTHAQTPAVESSDPIAESENVAVAAAVEPLVELPAHESHEDLPAQAGHETSTTPATQKTPKRRRGLSPAPDSPTPTNSEP